MALGGIAQATGSIYSANKSASSAKKLMASQIAWEKERAQNAHQWEVQDLMKAGLNPILSAGGSGATTSGVSGAMPDTSGYGQAISSAADVAMKNAQVDNINADTVGKARTNKWIDPISEKEIKESQSRMAVNSAKQAEINSNISLNSAKSLLTKEQAEQARKGVGSKLVGTRGISGAWNDYFKKKGK